MLPQKPERDWKKWNLNNNVKSTWCKNSPGRWNELSTLEKVELKVTTVDYYSRNQEFAICTHKPQSLNSLGEELCKEPTNHVNIPLEPSGFVDGPIENNMESLLNYIKTHRDVLDDVEFVTCRQILATAAANKNPMEIQAIKCHGKIWIRKLEESTEHLHGSVHFRDMARAASFERRIVEEKEENCQFTRRNGLFKTKLSQGEYGSILYPGELDAVDSSGGNVEIKSTIRDDFLRRRGPYCYWQCFLGNVEKVILGKIKENVVQTITIFSTEELGRKLFRGWPRFIVENGARRIREMLNILQRNLKEDGDSVVLTRKTWVGWDFVEDSWTMEEEQRVSENFENFVTSVFSVSQ